MLRLAPAAISTLQHQLHQRYVRKKMCLRTSYKKMNNWNLQQRINVKFHVLYEKSACETCAMSSDAHGTEAMKKSSILKWHKWFKQIFILEHDKNVFIQKCINWLNIEKVWNIVFQKKHNNQACLLCRNTDEVVWSLCTKWPEFCHNWFLHYDNTPVHRVQSVILWWQRRA